MITLNLTPDAWRFVRAYARVAMARHIPPFSVGLVLVCLLLSLVVSGNFELSVVTLILWVLGPYNLVRPLMEYAVVALRYRQRAGERPSTVFITEHGIRQVDPLVATDIAWPMFTSVIKTAESLIFLIPPRDIAAVLPRTAFDPADLASFEAYLAARGLIPVKKSPHRTPAPAATDPIAVEDQTEPANRGSSPVDTAVTS